MTRRPLISVALALALTLAVVTPTALHAQYRANLRVGISAPAAAQDAGGLPPLRIERKTHWLGGFIVGTIAGALVASRLVDVDPRHASARALVGLALFGGVLGGIPGALIGGQFPKE